MMKKVFLSFVLIFVFHFVFCQSYSFVYEVSNQNIVKKFILDVNDKESVFYEMPDSENSEQLGTELIIKKSKDSIYSYDIFDKQFYCVEKINSEWMLLNEKKKIKDFNSQKAEISLFGKKWEAWFTQDLMFNDGPYKFKGLPGLIISIEDKEKKYKFNLIEIKQDQSLYVSDKLDHSIKISVPEFLKKKKIKDSEGYMINQINDSNNIISPQTKKLFMEEIEKSKLRNVLMDIEKN